jgi:6-phosphogluconolactonase
MTAAGNRPLPGNFETRWHVMPAPAALATAVCARILEAAANAISRHGRFRIVLAGGSTPQAVYKRLAASTSDWSRWQVYFGDERCLPADHPQRNSAMAAGSWLEQVPLPLANIHPIPAERGATAAASAYTEVVRAARPFDLVLLGMGEDGHTASLFPGRQGLADEAVLAVQKAPKPPPDRVSLGTGALSDAAGVLVMISGAGKHAAVQRWKHGEDLPVTRIHGQAGVDVYIDNAAETGEAA